MQNMCLVLDGSKSMPTRNQSQHQVRMSLLTTGGKLCDTRQTQIPMSENGLRRTRYYLSHHS